MVIGRQGNGIGMKIVGGKLAPGCKDVGAYVATIFKGGVAEQLHGELQEGIFKISLLTKTVKIWSFAGKSMYVKYLAHNNFHHIQTNIILFQ